jgi:putative hemolysin
MKRSLPSQPQEDAKLQRMLQAFSYSYAEDAWWKRQITRLVERLSGQPFFTKLYLAYRAAPTTDKNFFVSAERMLQLTVDYDADRLAAWPKRGPLVVVCNHPFGVIDGVIACRLTAAARGDFRILINSVLDLVEETAPYFLPIDFSGTKAAQATNLKSRNAALDYLKQGGCVVIFPAGEVATTRRLWSRRPQELPWKNLVARMVQESHAAVAPVYFAGSNSPLFQIASHLSMTLRMALYFRETRRMMGARIAVRLGAVMPYETLADAPSRIALTARLRRAVQTLGGKR